jgi:hypothetical protein
MRLLLSLAATALLAAACGGTAAAPSPSPTVARTATPTPAPTPQLKYTFTADLKTTNEVPPISNAEAPCAGKGAFVLNTTKDTAGKITAATADFDLSVTGCPANTALTLFHVHKAAAGANGGPVVTGKGDAANPIALATGATTSNITRTAITVDPTIASEIIAAPSGYYFNVHSTNNGGGVIRGQLAAG